jgi:hypothetical protein
VRRLGQAHNDRLPAIKKDHRRTKWRLEEEYKTARADYDRDVEQMKERHLAGIDEWRARKARQIIDALPRGRASFGDEAPAHDPVWVT